MEAHQLINQATENCEWYTPKPIIEAARETMGHFDLDPTSSITANERVQARVFWGENDDVLNRPWHGHVWMNHPFSRGNNPRFIDKLAQEYAIGHIIQACCITYACTSEQWFQPLMEFPQCYLSPRTNYLLPDGSIKRGVTKGSVVTYLGDKVFRFAEAFKNLGTVKVAL